MKKNKFIFAILAVFLPITAFQNCDLMQAASFDVDDSSFESLAQSDRVVNLETLLTGLIEQERRERMQADAALEGRIENLETLVVQNRLDLQEQIDGIEVNQVNLQNQINDMQGQFDQRLTQLQGVLTQLESDFNIQLGDVRNLTSVRLDQLADDVEGQLTALETTLIERLQQNAAADEARSQEIMAEIVRINQEIVSIKSSHEQLIAYVNQTFVTKDEFNQLQASFDALKEIVDNLDMKIDQTAAELEAELGTEITTIRSIISGIHNDIQALTLADENLMTRLDQIVQDYKTELDSLGTSLRELIFETEEKILYLVEQGDIETRQTLLDSIRIEATQQSLLIQTVTASFAQKIEELERQVAAGNNSEEVEALNSRLLEYKQEMSLLIAAEQRQRDELQNQVDLLAEEITRVKDDVAMIHLITLENRQLIDDLTVAFEDEKRKTIEKFGLIEADVDEKLAGIRGDFNSQMEELMSIVSQLSDGLGQSYHEQLMKTVEEVAILKNEVANHETVLINLARQQSSDNAKIVQLSAQVNSLTQPLSRNIVKVIHSYLEVQRIFMGILAPNDRNLQAWDIDFRRFMNQCGGDTDLSFPNAMGMESFQFINLEFMRLMVSGVRSGQSSDGIFHNFGAAFEDNGFHRTFITTLANQAYGHQNPECLNNIQHWARTVIFEEPSFEFMREKMKNNGELAAAITDLYTEITGIKADAEKINEMLNSFVAGMFNETEVLNQVLAQYSIKFINFAMHYSTIESLVKEINHITIVQVQLGETRYQALIDSMMEKIEDFAVTTEIRISRLEQIVGTLSAQMEAVLQLVNCTSSEACRGPSVITPLIPVIEPPAPPAVVCSEPEITFAQHFFTSPYASKAISHWGQWERHRNAKGIEKVTAPIDVCEASETTAMRDLHDLNINLLKNCWVNFRRIPKEEWGNSIDTFALRLHGQMSRVRVQCEGSFDKTFDLTAGDGATTMYGTNKKGIFDIPIGDALTGENYSEIIQKANRIQQCTITPLCEQAGESYDYEFTVYSPLVMDFKFEGKPHLTDLFNGVHFDLDNDGTVDKTAWIKGHQTGLLSMDRNNDGLINNGSELFGQATPGNNGGNGFQALAQLDTHRDGIIDQKDKMFSKLLIWFDINGDGISQSTELSSLAEKGVTEISLSYKRNEKNFAQSVNDSEIKYSARFKGPKVCGSKGCQIHDVYFGKAKSSHKLSMRTGK